MKDAKSKKKNRSKKEELEVDRRKFLEKSAKDIGAAGFAIYDIAKTIKEEVVQGVVNEIKDAIRRP